MEKENKVQLVLYSMNSSDFLNALPLETGMPWVNVLIFVIGCRCSMVQLVLCIT